MKLSIIIPLYNEQNTIKALLSKVCTVDLPGVAKEIIVVNDGSTDNSLKKVHEFIDENPNESIIILDNERNMGKGHAIRTGLAHVSGDFVLVQDADLEYEPMDYPSLLDPVLTGKADVVYGNRFHYKSNFRRQYLAHYLANRMLTKISNSITGLKLNDMECCYKLIPVHVIKDLELHETSFGFEPEITAALAGIKGLRIVEVPVRYNGRKYHEGKKIGFFDGIRAIYCILYYGIRHRRLR